MTSLNKETLQDWVLGGRALRLVVGTTRQCHSDAYDTRSCVGGQNENTDMKRVN